MIPSPTPTVSACAGDCDANGAVSEDERSLCLQINIGDQTLNECPACDATGDGNVSINDLVIIQNNVNNGCPG